MEVQCAGVETTQPADTEMHATPVLEGVQSGDGRLMDG